MSPSSEAGIILFRSDDVLPRLNPDFACGVLTDAGICAMHLHRSDETNRRNRDAVILGVVPNMLDCIAELVDRRERDMLHDVSFVSVELL
jgi:hypothetical protein